MSAVLWMNIPLMILAFGLMVGIPLWMVMRRSDWHGKHETPAVPAYLARRARLAAVRAHRPAAYDRRSIRPAAGRANG